MQDMGLKFSRDEASVPPPPQQEECATETPTGGESQCTHIIRTIEVEDESARDNDMKAAAPVSTAGAKEAEKTVPEKLPHNYEAILKDADGDFHIDNSSMELLYKQLHDGVFLNHKRQKYFVDKESGSNSFILYARELKITWGEDSRYWNWFKDPETSDASVEVAELKNVCWLEIDVKFDTTKLTPGTLYQVSFDIKMKESSIGWDHHPVNLRLRLPDGTMKESKQKFDEIPKEEWKHIPVGEFLLTPENTGEIDISMDEKNGGKWKSGLIIKGVIIQPKNNKAAE